MSYHTPPSKAPVIEIRASLNLYEPDQMRDCNLPHAYQLPQQHAARYARWWLPIPAKGDTVGVGSEPVYFTVDRVEWWPGEPAAIIDLEPVHMTDPAAFREHLAALESEGWITDEQWHAQLTASP